MLVHFGLFLMCFVFTIVIFLMQFGDTEVSVTETVIASVSAGFALFCAIGWVFHAIDEYVKFLS